MTSSIAEMIRHFPGRERRSSIWRIALPIMGGMMSQNLLNLVDIGMVGRLGDNALAATGKDVLITDEDSLKRALEGRAGTFLVTDGEAEYATLA